MEKRILLAGHPDNAKMSWFISADGDLGDIQVSLVGKSRKYFKDIPNHVQIYQGAEIISGEQMSLLITSNDPELESSLTVANYLSSDGSNHGKNYVLICQSPRKRGSLFIQVSMREITVSKKEEDDLIFITNLFYQYLSQKSQFLFNYVQDKEVGELAKSYDLKVKSGAQSLQKWFDLHNQAVKDSLQKYKLILTTLIKHEHHYENSELTYSQWGDMMFATGTKRWRETRVTMQSCPFQFIRGTLLNESEREIFNKTLTKTAHTALFGEKIKMVASHSSIDAQLTFRPTRELNFRNFGLQVLGPEKSIQEKIIQKGLAYSHQIAASVLILPELAIDEDKLDFLEKTLSQYSDTTLKVVVGASHYAKAARAEEGFTNSAPVYFNHSGKWEKLFTYHKMIPFSTRYQELNENLIQTDLQLSDKLLVEDISVSSNIALIPMKDGVIGIANCRDVLDLADPHNPIHRYANFVDLMLIISENSGNTNMFVGVAECLARWHNCATLYTNSVAQTQKISGADDKLEVSFAIAPKKGVDSPTSIAGEISYISNPFINQQNLPEEAENILFSGELNYVALTQEELDRTCKSYEVK